MCCGTKLAFLFQKVSPLAWSNTFLLGSVGGIAKPVLVHGIAHHGIYRLLEHFSFKKNLFKGRLRLWVLLLIEALGGLWRMLGGV